MAALFASLPLNRHKRSVVRSAGLTDAFPVCAHWRSPGAMPMATDDELPFKVENATT